MAFIVVWAISFAAAGQNINPVTLADCGRQLSFVGGVRFPEGMSVSSDNFWIMQTGISGMEIYGDYPRQQFYFFPRPRTTVIGNELLVRLFIEEAPFNNSPLTGCGSLPRLPAGQYRIRFEAHDIARSNWRPVGTDPANYDSPNFRAHIVYEAEFEILPAQPIPAGNPWTWALLGAGVLLTPLAFRTRMQ